MKMFEEIIEYCLANNIEINKGFLNKIPEIFSYFYKENLKIYKITDEEISELRLFGKYYLPNNYDLNDIENLKTVKLLKNLDTEINLIKKNNYLKLNEKYSKLYNQFPELFKKFDSEQLISSNELKVYNDAFEYKNYIIELDEKINYDLKKYIFKLISKKIEVKIRLSHFNIFKKDKYQIPIFKAKVYGKNFKNDYLNKKLFSNRLQSKFQRIETQENKHLLIMFEKVKQFEILRTERDKIFLLTECLPEIQDNDKFIETLILHSDIDYNGIFFNHIDLSLLFYSNDNYDIRIKKELKDKINADYHIKLMRIEKKFSMNEWANLLLLSYPRNELVIEFLTGNELSNDTLDNFL